MKQYLSDARRSVSLHLPAALQTLTNLVAIPSVSWDSFDADQVRRSAEAVAQYASDLDFFDTVDILQSSTADPHVKGKPAVVARKHATNEAPTVLLYAHHDVQPPGDASQWNTSPFVATEINGRLYGRGAADDKAGIVSHVESLRALRDVLGSVDLGVVLFIEGEEEAGSPSFDNFLVDHRDLLQADVIIVADSTNFTETIPALTVSLRGNVTLNLRVKTLDHALHSGMFGGAVPDAMMAFTQLMSRCISETGECVIPGIVGRSNPTPAYTEEQLRRESGVLPGVSTLGHGPILHQLWHAPTVTITGMDIPAVSEASNTLLPEVRARLSFRIPPTVDVSIAATRIVEFFTADAPFGAIVSCEDISAGSGYSVMNGSVADSSREAMKLAWDVEPVDIGVGGSIPFIASFVKEFPQAAVLVTGVEDPDTRAHSPNESLHLAAFEKAVVSQTVFLCQLNGGLNEE